MSATIAPFSFHDPADHVILRATRVTLDDRAAVGQDLVAGLTHDHGGASGEFKLRLTVAEFVRPSSV